MSIRRYLLLILLSVITLISFAAAVQGYRASMREAQKFFDLELQSFALTLTAIPLTQTVIEVDRSATVAYQIWQHDQLIVKTSNSPDDPISQFDTDYAERNFSGQRWRTYAYQTPAYQPTESERWILVAQPLSRRFELAEKMILAAVSPLIIAIPILAIFISMTIKRSLEPLKELTSTLRRKKTDDFSAIDLGSPPAELAPVIVTLNRLLDRLDNAFIREKRFSSDAAHELRTPLSVLQVNIHNLEHAMLSRNLDLSPLKLGVERMSHVVEQILLLNRTNPDHFTSKFVELDLYHLAQEVIADIYPHIEENGQSIELSGDQVSVQGDSFTLTTLIYNLVSNASKYSPPGGEIRVTVRSDNSVPQVDIADSGPGIPDTELGRVFDRFYRVGGDQHASLVTGCGLGLAIVKQIADLHSADIRITNESPLGGLLVQVRFNEQLTRVQTS